MATPFHKYLSVKDNYCIVYCGDDKQILKNIILARDIIERELKGIKIFIICNDIFKQFTYGKRNITIESKSNIFAGKMAYTRVVEDSNFILEENFLV